MNVLDLFSGIGGFSLGLDRVGFKTVAFCERDAYCQAVLRKHWPDVPCFDDVRTLNKRKLKEHGIGTIDLICGGYPCQPESLAGKRRSKNDDRYLWPEMFRLIGELRPTWVIGENVVGHLTLGLDGVLSDLEGAGYSARAFVIPACALDAPHRRERVWVVAYANCERKLQPQGANREERGWFGDRRETLADAKCFGRSEVEQSVVGGAQSEGPADTAQHSSFTGGWEGWPPEPSVGRVADGVPNRVDRTQALGNALVPEIPEIIGRAIKESLLA